MMRGRDHWALAVRTPDDRIHVESTTSIRRLPGIHPSRPACAA